MQPTFNSKGAYVPNPKKNHNDTRWIASLSDGTTVFEDVTPGKTTAWRRLRQYVKLHNLKVTNLRLEAYGRSLLLIPYKDAADQPQLNGYWQSKKASALLCDGGVVGVQACGIGYLKGRTLFLSWVEEDGVVRQEIREHKNGDEAVIVNDEP